jgi:hypothetical protein
MKKILAALLLLPALAMGAANDLFINQRNALDTGTLSRTVTIPTGGANGIFGFNGSTVLPVFFTLGPSLTINGGVIDAVVAVPTWASITDKPAFSTVATSGAYADLAGIPSTFAPAAHTQAWSTITATPTTRDGYGITDAYPLTGNPSGFLTGITSGQVTAALGFTPYSATNPSAYINQAGARSSISLTTTGTAGAATYNSSSGVLNIPNYAPGTGTVTSVIAGAGLSGGTITTTGTISMPNTGTAGSYANVTTDAQGRVTSGTSRSQASATRALNTAFQISTTRDADARYSVQCTVTASIAGGQNCDVFLEIASDQAFTTNVQQVGVVGQGQVYTLAIALQGVQPQTQQVIGYVPAGYWARIRTVQNLGAPTFSFRLGQEILQ